MTAMSTLRRAHGHTWWISPLLVSLVLRCNVARGQELEWNAPSELPSFSVVSVKVNESFFAGVDTLVAGQGASPEFDVVSIRRRVTPTGSIRTILGNGVFDRPNITLDALIVFAYDLDPYQLLNSPSWARTERFDVSARGSETATVPEIRLMMRRVLEDRFQLVARSDIREMDTYVLTLAKPGSGPPSGLKRNTDSCKTLVVAPPGTPRGGATVVGCDTSEGIAGFLSKTLGKHVEDRTGLSGNFEYSFYYAAIEGGLAPAATTGDLPSIESALPEQLGLRLIASRAPVAVLVVDSVDHPSEN